MNTYYGIKDHMTQTWDSEGKRIPVTVISISPLTVTQVKSDQTKDGYSALQVGFGVKKKHVKPLAKHLTASKASPRHLREVAHESTTDLKVGDQIPVTDVLSVGDTVTVRSVSKGRGFAGVIKRWGFSGGPKTHGQSDRHRAPGSIGQGTDPGRVHKGKKMAGRFGNQQFAIKNLQIVHIDSEAGTLWLSGPIPGYRGQVVTITKVREGKFPGLFYSADVSSTDADANDEQPKADTKPETSPADNSEATDVKKADATTPESESESQVKE